MWGAAFEVPAQHDNFETAIEEEGLTGVVWSTLTPDGIATGAAGFADAKSRELILHDSKVQTGSLVKTLVATGILRLVTEGRLGLDIPVSTLLPEFEFDNPWMPGNPVLVQHLLDHTSGLEDARLGQIFSMASESDTPLSMSFPNTVLRIRSRPGSRVSYSNQGYTLLGMLIERVTGERYEQYLDKQLLQPLGMHQSSFRFISQVGPHADARLVMGHFENGVTQLAVPMYLRPAGQFTTTASDMALFAGFLMSNGEVDGKAFITFKLLQSMGRPTTTEAAMAGLVDAGYGLGLNSRDRHGVLANCHVGTSIGFRASFCVFPHAQKAFFVAMNADVETADYDRFDALLIRELDITASIPSASITPSIGIVDWQGIYVLAPNRMQSFAYIDRALNFATLRWDGQQLHMKPFQNASRSLLPVGDWLFRAEDRVRASHVLLVADDGQRIISDGFRSYQKISLWHIIPIWISLIAGLVGLVYLFFTGIFRILRHGVRKSDPMVTAFFACTALFLPIPLFYSQSFLQLGELTPASGLLALVTGLLPLAMIFGLWGSVRQDAKDRSLLGMLAMLSVLQWCVVLAFWGLVPLRLWV
ncbi:MAG: serine hydrolase domain-containing protein [Pseudohongiella sp.]|nr:serine hydrolase domain-containing protein [Pseudohongiella sp.]